MRSVSGPLQPVWITFSIIRVQTRCDQIIRVFGCENKRQFRVVLFYGSNAMSTRRTFRALRVRKRSSAFFGQTTKDSLSSSELITPWLGFRPDRVVVSLKPYTCPYTVSERNTHTSDRRNRARKKCCTQREDADALVPSDVDACDLYFSFLAPTTQCKDSMPKCFRLFIGIRVTTSPWMTANHTYYSMCRR